MLEGGDRREKNSLNLGMRIGDKQMKKTHDTGTVALDPKGKASSLWTVFHHSEPGQLQSPLSRGDMACIKGGRTTRP